jgi:hypothetical protein
VPPFSIVGPQLSERQMYPTKPRYLHQAIMTTKIHAEQKIDSDLYGQRRKLEWSKTWGVLCAALRGDERRDQTHRRYWILGRWRYLRIYSYDPVVFYRSQQLGSDMK